MPQKNKFLVSDWVKENGKRLRLELKEKLIQHPGEAGSAREVVLREFIQKNIPQKFGVDTGFVFDSKGDTSKQTDLIVYDKEVCPSFSAVGDKKFFPCEAVVAAAEIKSNILNKSSLRSAFNNLRSIKSLDRSASQNAIDMLRGEHIDNISNHLHQVFTIIFVINRSIPTWEVSKALFEENYDNARHLWPNMIFNLDHYLITYACERGHCPNPMDALSIANFDEQDPDRILLTFLSMIVKAIVVTRTSSPNYHQLFESSTPLIRKEIEFKNPPITNPIPDHLLKRPKGYD
ncbi:MAG: hypothetical protein RJQ09_17360 [Cyclobacteriaceae bacterium]